MVLFMIRQECFSFRFVEKRARVDPYSRILITIDTDYGLVQLYTRSNCIQDEKKMSPRAKIS